MIIRIVIDVEPETIHALRVSRFRYRADLPHLNTTVHSTNRNEFLELLEKSLIGTEGFIKERS